MNTVGLIVAIVVIILILLLLYWIREKPVQAAPVTQKVEKVEKVQKVSTGKDNLTLVEGIGPKIQKMLEAEGIQTYGDLAKADVAKLRAIMDANKLRIADPTTWPKQAALLADGKMDELKKYQDKLKGGRE